MAYIEGRNNKGEVVEKYASMNDMKMALGLSDPLIFELLNTTKESLGIKYYCEAFLNVPKKDRRNAFEKEFNFAEDGDPTPEYVDQDRNCTTKEKYFKNRNAHMEEMVFKKKTSPLLESILEEHEEKQKEDKLGGKDGGSYSANGSSAHYKKAVLEYVDKQERCYGTFLAYGLCFMQVDKYRDRAGKKEGVPAEKDIVKATWYDTCSQYLREKIDLFNQQKEFEKDIEEGDVVHIDVAYAAIDQVKLEFDKKYGAGRSDYIELPANLVSLLGGELSFTLNTKLKGLGQIVDELQTK